MSADAPEGLDKRTFIRSDAGAPDNPKFLVLDYVVTALGLHWAATGYCKLKGTDGIFPRKLLLKSAGEPEADAVRAATEEMIKVGLFHDSELTEDQCKRCQAPAQGHLVIHDYGQHQKSTAAQAELSERRREYGRRGGETRWGPHREAEAKKLQAEVEEAKSNGEESPVREEVLELCNLLADGIAKFQQVKRPNVTKRWTLAMTRLLDLDKYPEPVVRAVIDWVVQDEWNGSKVLSPNKLRERFVDLNARARADFQRKKNGVPQNGRPNRGAPTGPLNLDGQNELFLESFEDAP